MKKSILSLAIMIILSHGIIAQSLPKVNFIGAMNKMGNTYDLKVWLDTIPDKSNLFAIGPYGRMKGEITVVDGKPFNVSAFENDKAVVSQNWNIRSPFFVYCNVKEWQEFSLEGPLTSVQEIQDKVAALAKIQGYKLNEPFAFRITGDFDQLTLHIVTPRNPEVEGYNPDVKYREFTFDNEKGELVGFYSEQHQGIYTGSKSFVHVHYLRGDESFMGHLNKINTANKSFKLYLPKKQMGTKTGMRVNDTDFSKGRLGNIQNIDLDDLVKFHGHLCDGLVVGHLALKQALAELYPNGIVDRTNTRVVSTPSPCLTDAAIFTTGGRYQFNTFYVSSALNGLFTVQRIDNEKTVSVQMKEGLKPKEIDKLGALAVKGELAACDLDKLKVMEDNFTEKLLSIDPEDNFIVTEVSDFEWDPILKTDYVKTDILNKQKSNCQQ